ncbi:MAG: alpha-amylase [Gemmatimonadetes bacterium]|nr:alpha-amylase [Gemmatimonadota bacterium]
MTRLRVFLLSTLIFAGCSRGDGKAPAVPAKPVVAAPAPAWTERATIYEVNLRQYTPSGTLAAFTRELPRLRKLGVDILWIMPVQPIGQKNRKGSLGSYYAIRDYRGVNPEYGTRADFSAMVTEAHKLGFKVILDWVANHTAFDHDWITAHPDWYSKNKDGTIANARDNEGHDTDWTDVAELDYDKPAMRQAMIADMRFWVDSMALDGFRCDVAGGAPDDFWMEARTALATSRPDLFWLAEAEAPTMHAAFNATYGWRWHHLMNDIAKGKKPVAELDRYLEEERAAYPAGAFRMYFTSNHDENSWNGSEFERMGANHQPAFVLAGVLGAGGEPEQTAPLLRQGHDPVDRAVARGVLRRDARAQGRERRARQRGVGGAAGGARAPGRRQGLRLHAHA